MTPELGFARRIHEWDFALRDPLTAALPRTAPGRGGPRGGLRGGAHGRGSAAEVRGARRAPGAGPRRARPRGPRSRRAGPQVVGAPRAPRWSVGGLPGLPATPRGRTAIPDQPQHPSSSLSGRSRRRTAARARGRRRPRPTSPWPRAHARRPRRARARPTRSPRSPADLTAARARAARRPVRGRRGARRRGRRAGRPRAASSSAFVFACERHADQRRPVGEDFIIHPVGVAKICAGMRLDTATLCAALLHDTVEDTTASLDEVREEFGEEVGAPRRRRDQALRHHLPEPRRPPGRELPQDDGRDGPGHPGHPDQARRPPAQHAHDRLDAEAQAAGEGEGDARDLRAARAPARHPRDQVGARGPRVRDAPPAQVQRDQAAGHPAAQRARGATSSRAGQLPAARSWRRSASRRRSPAARSTSTRSTRR